MKKIKVAILEDSIDLALDLKEQLEETKLIKVLFCSQGSSDFLRQCNESFPDAVVLDIDLQGDAMTGLDVANKLRLPSLFISGKVMEFHKEIEDINAEIKPPVFTISKPVTSMKLNGILPKFLEAVSRYSSSIEICIDFEDRKQVPVAVNKIVCIMSKPGRDGNSNNKEIFFTDRPSATLYNFTLGKMQERGFPKEQFIQVNKYCVINRNIFRFYKGQKAFPVRVFDSTESFKQIEIKVSDVYIDRE